MKTKNFLSPTGLALLCAFILLYQSVQAQNSPSQFVVSGKVLGENNEPLAGAIILVEGTLYGVSTDENGYYKLKLHNGQHRIRYSFTGYKTHYTNIAVNENTTLDITLEVNTVLTDEVVVTATRADKNSAQTYSELKKEDIEKNNLGIDLPYLLDQTPSVVVTSDAGAGIGYTGIRIRGTDPTRINVTVNGIPLNDAESHGVWWVNMPDFASGTENIQIQRGVGTSTNGAGAFGGSINLLTNTIKEKSYTEINNAIGSYNTRRHTIKIGSGIINNHFTFDLRLSSIYSDGYIERAFSDLKSFFFSGNYFDNKQTITTNIFSGKEHTYQAWAGIPKDSLATNRRYNPYTYDNETDNYTQTHYQLFYNRKIANKLNAHLALFYTRGKGFYEQYKENQDFSDYNLNPLIIGNDTIQETDLIRRRWLDNHFYGTVFSFNYNENGKFNAILGGGWNNYTGKHFGEIIWARYASNSNIRHRYYDNDAEKSDFNIYTRFNYRYKKLVAFVDLQYRTISYNFLGFNDSLLPQQQTVNFGFFNPKAGLTYNLSGNQYVFASYSVGNKEPNRNDFTETSPGSRPKHETLYDTELGYRLSKQKISAGVTLYHMQYHNQLVLTGQINDVGAYTRTNVKNSFRRGIELELAVKPHQRIIWAVNTTLSENKIIDFNEYVDNWDTWDQIKLEYSKTDIAFSPGVIAGSEITFNLLHTANKLAETEQQVLKNQHKLDASFITKYVGKQFIDNTSSTERMLDAYTVNDIRITYALTFKNKTQLALNFMIRNVFNELYVSNAWVYRYYENAQYQNMFGFYPQAERNYLLGLNIHF